jgi:hypothetical protein
MTPILHYRGFWDVPRMFFVRYRGDLLLFDCPFDEQAEDHQNDYRVYLMPEMTDSDLGGPWVLLPQKALRLLATIPVVSVIFDPSKRKSIDSAVLHHVSASSE